jgi:hypothetical protein
VAKQEPVGRTPPHNLEAEEALLGAAMLSGAALEVAVSEVDTSDFYRPAHAAVHDAMSHLWRIGLVNIDPVIVADELRPQDLEAIGGLQALIAIQARTPATSSAPYYARVIVEHSVMRQMIAASSSIAELGYGLPDDPYAALDQAREILGSVDMPIGGGDPSPTMLDIMATEQEYNWLVPGLIERQDRLVITGPEGGGKSTLLRQLAMCLACGIHPFRFEPIAPCRVLYVDVENTQPQIKRKAGRLVELTGGRLADGDIPGDRLRWEIRTEGLDLLQRHDRRWLLERVAVNRPDVLIMGPLYKLHAGDPNEEMPARTVAAAIDTLRGRFGITFISEAHSPHGEGVHRPVRPIGASLWLRWPEFGYGLRPVPDEPNSMLFVPWRGPRDEREWPTRLVRGGEGAWPWMDAGYEAPALPGDRF